MPLREFTQFHESPAVIAWWMRLLERPLVWFTPPWRRRGVLAIAAIFVGVVTVLHALGKYQGIGVPAHGWRAAAVVCIQFLLLWLVYRAAANFAQLPAGVRRHPHISLHACFWLMLVVLWWTSAAPGPWRGILMGLALVLPMLLWRCGYLVLAGQHGRMGGTRARDHVFYLWPAWGGSDTPYGKGPAYLSQNEASTTEALARSQLAGLRLLLLAVVLRLVLTAYEGVLYGPGNRLTHALGGATLGLPTMQALLPLGAQAPLAQSWASIYGQLFEEVLRMAIKGHLIIGVLRLYGYHVFRNTYKPLLAESVVEFWNRYFFYFKELLSTFFFMPTFMGFGKRLRRWPNLRLLAAVFAAAFVGNVYYHVIKEPALARGQWMQVFELHRSRMFYCLLLAAGIFVSMLREQGRRGQSAQPGRLVRLLRMGGVWTFFGLIFIWNADGGAPFLSRLDFFLHLFGLA